jgi:hypothetical protein
MSMNCQVGSPLDPEEPAKLTQVEYWYAIEATAGYVPEMTFELESKIQAVAKRSITLCVQHGNRRMEEDGEAYYIDENGRRLAIMAMNSGPLDQPYSDDKRK